jgi:hypothetical protein
MATSNNLVFRGDIAPGHNFMAVRQRLKDMFRLDDDGINRLFCGRPVTIKKNLAEAEAQKWAAALLKAGALVEVQPNAPDQLHSAQSDRDAPMTEVPSAGDASWDLAPVGADVLKAHERRPIEEASVSIDHLSVDAVGADVLKPCERTPFVPLELDLSHISVE